MSRERRVNPLLIRADSTEARGTAVSVSWPIALVGIGSRPIRVRLARRHGRDMIPEASLPTLPGGCRDRARMDGRRGPQGGKESVCHAGPRQDSAQLGDVHPRVGDTRALCS
jgi:hypothetical protein